MSKTTKVIKIKGKPSVKIEGNKVTYKNGSHHLTFNVSNSDEAKALEKELLKNGGNSYNFYRLEAEKKESFLKRVCNFLFNKKK